MNRIAHYKYPGASALDAYPVVKSHREFPVRYGFFTLVLLSLMMLTRASLAQDVDLLPRDGVNGYELQGAGLNVTSIASGDFNGDGLTDTAMGMSMGQTGSGYGASVHILYGTGSEEGDPERSLPLANGSSSTFFHSNGTGALFWRIASAGDVNGDGYDDLLIDDNAGLHYESIDGFPAHATYLLYGAPRYASFDLELLLLDRQAIEIVSPAGVPGYRKAISTAGDINGDGYDDIAIGYPGIPRSGDLDMPASDRVYLIFGRHARFNYTVSLDALDAQTGRVFHAPNEHSCEDEANAYWIGENQQFGRSLAAAGDIDGDGLDDLVIGAPGSYDECAVSYGRMVILYGDLQLQASTPGGFTVTTGLDVDPFAEGRGVQIINGLFLGGDSRTFADPVAPAGDVNNDGFQDVIFASSAGAGVLLGDRRENPVRCDWPGEDVHRSLYELLRAETDDSACYFAVMVEPAYENCDRDRGLRLASQAGDINGDGFDDLLVTPDKYDTAGCNPSPAAVVFGSFQPKTVGIPTLTAEEGLRFLGPGMGQDEQRPALGYTVGWMGDRTLNGRDEILFGTPPGVSANIVYHSGEDE